MSASVVSLADSHCHLPILGDVDHGHSVSDALDAARAGNVDYMLCVCIDIESYPAVLNLARGNRHIFASVGVHPNSRDCEEPSEERLCSLADDSEVVAIGETGLDYYRSTGDLEWQRERFRLHIRAARKANKPLIIHCRDAGEDVASILEQEHAEMVGGVMHCFVDGWEIAERAMALGFYISFSGIVTFKNAKSVQEVARQVPDQYLLIETDAPYLAPVPFRGKPNQPAYVRHVAEYLAELRQTPLEDLARLTTDNFFRLFKDAQP